MKAIWFVAVLIVGAGVCLALGRAALAEEERESSPVQDGRYVRFAVYGGERE